MSDVKKRPVDESMHVAPADMEEHLKAEAISQLDEPAQLTANRAALKAAIAAAAAAAAAEDRAKTGVVRARDLLRMVERNLKSASAAVAAVQAEQSARMLEAISAGSPPPPYNPAVQNARIQERAAGDEIKAAEAVLDVAEAAVAEPEQAAKKARERVLAAAAVVLATPALRLLEEAKAVQADLIKRRVALRYLVRNLDVTPAIHEVREFLRYNTDLPGFGSVEFEDWNKHQANAPWKDAHDALTRISDTPLPDK
jgi:hypothetical protein